MKFSDWSRLIPIQICISIVSQKRFYNFSFFMKRQYWNVFMFSHSNISVRHSLMRVTVRTSPFHVQMSSNQNKKNKSKTSFQMIFQKMTYLKHFWHFIKQGEKCTEITHQTITKHKSTDPINFWHIFPFVSKYLRVFGQRQIYCIVLCSLVFFFFFKCGWLFVCKI